MPPDSLDYRTDGPAAPLGGSELPPSKIARTTRTMPTIYFLTLYLATSDTQPMRENQPFWNTGGAPPISRSNCTVTGFPSGVFMGFPLTATTHSSVWTAPACFTFASEKNRNTDHSPS